MKSYQSGFRCTRPIISYNKMRILFTNAKGKELEVFHIDSEKGAIIIKINENYLPGKENYLFHLLGRDKRSL